MSECQQKDIDDVVNAAKKSRDAYRQKHAKHKSPSHSSTQNSQGKAFSTPDPSDDIITNNSQKQNLTKTVDTDINASEQPASSPDLEHASTDQGMADKIQHDDLVDNSFDPGATGDINTEDISTITAPLNLIEPNIQGDVIQDNVTMFTDPSASFGEIVQDNLSDGAAGVADIFTDVAAIPGLFATGRSFATEISLFNDNKTSLSELFEYTIVPNIGRGLLIGLGVVLDTAAFGTTGGLFTLAGGWLGGKIAKDYVRDDLKAEQKKLQSCFDELHNRAMSGHTKIVETIQSNFEDFPNIVANVPGFSETEHVQHFQQSVLELYAADTHVVLTDVDAAYNEAISNIKESNLVDKILGIDRPQQITAAYQASQAMLTDRIVQSSNEFADKAQDSPSEFMASLNDYSYVENGSAVALIENIPYCLPEMVGEYASMLNMWKSECIEVWEDGLRHVNEETQIQSKLKDELAENLKPTMETYRSKIRTHLERLGKDPGLCP